MPKKEAIKAKVCPVCGLKLSTVDRMGIDVDMCSKCGGVWLDKDELEKILQRSEGIYNDENPEDY